MSMIQCHMCLQWKHSSRFKKFPNGTPDMCLSCFKGEKSEINPLVDGTNRARLLVYKLSPDDYNKMFVDQQGKCKICLRSFYSTTPHIDHNHTTGKVRGLLCFACNSGLGQFADDYERVGRAAEYLYEDWKKNG